MNCWICGEVANSGEHLIKASDLKSLFGSVTQKKPLFFHTNDSKNIPIGSIKSDRFKSNTLICADCNNNKTSRYDYAWQKLSEQLRTYPLHKRGPLNIRTVRVFGNNVYKNAVNVHLYFVKLFGCRIIEDSIPIDTASFSDSLLNHTPNPYVFIHFKKAIGSSFKMSEVTPIHAVLDDNKNVVVATWMYAVGDLNVEIFYSKNCANSRYLKESYHPDCQYKVLRFKDFSED